MRGTRKERERENWGSLLLLLRSENAVVSIFSTLPDPHSRRGDITCWLFMTKSWTKYPSFSDVGGTRLLQSTDRRASPPFFILYILYNLQSIYVVLWYLLGLLPFFINSLSVYLLLLIIPTKLILSRWTWFLMNVGIIWPVCPSLKFFAPPLAKPRWIQLSLQSVWDVLVDMPESPAL